MNSGTLLSDPFSLDGPGTTTGNYIGHQVTGYPNNEEEDGQRAGGLASVPLANGVRYHAPQSTMHDLHYPSSNTLAMTAPEACSDSFSATSGPLFSQMVQHSRQFDRMQDFRRVPSLHSPGGMSATMQSPLHSVNSISALMGRNNAYPSSYPLQRGMGLPLGGINDSARSHGYSGNPRDLEIMHRDQTSQIQQTPVQPPQPLTAETESPPAPPFEDTTVLESIVADVGGTQQIVMPEVHAKIGRGFFPSDSKWTCYRRNYFAVTCSFSLHPCLTNTPLYLRNADQTLEPIQNFAMSISAIVNGQYGETRELVQHTPKRDKQSERPPPRVILQPSPPPSLASKSGNGSQSFPLGSQSLDYHASFAGAPQPPQSHVFERIQFQKATANNGKRRAQQQFYNLVVELQAEVTDPSGELQWVLVARRHSHSMVVRGRSPGHYKDGPRDSTASMGPKGGSGDGGSTITHGLGQAARPQLLLADTAHRASLYGRADYRQMPATEHSPISESSLVPSSSSSGFEYTMVNDTMDPMDAYQDPFTGGTSGHRSTAGGFDPVYSTYSGYSTIHSTRSVCT